MRPIVIWDVSDYDQTILMLYHVYSKKKRYIWNHKKIRGKRHAWTELPFAEVFPPNTSFYRADEACPRLEGLQKNLSGLSAEMGSGPQATDWPSFPLAWWGAFSLTPDSRKKMCRPVILWFCLWSMPNWESLNKAVRLSKTRWLHVWSCDKLHSLTATHM